MPHITIEYSANVGLHHDIAALVDAVHAAALQHGLAPTDGLRTRAARRDHYRVADGRPDYAFVSIMVRIGPGRDAQAKSSFLETVLGAAEAAIAAEDGPLVVAWSAELSETDARFRINRNEVRARNANDTRVDVGGGVVPGNRGDVRTDAVVDLGVDVGGGVVLGNRDDVRTDAVPDNRGDVDGGAVPDAGADPSGGTMPYADAVCGVDTVEESWGQC